MNEVNLSYIITTKNKLQYLRHVIEKLLTEIQSDEEIVVVDSDSNDGTKEYLTELFNKRLIHKYLSEKDFAQAHGCNKALLMAEGKLLKIINDDDMFFYEGIRKCKHFMLEHPEIDLIGTDGAGINCQNNDFHYHSTYPAYLNSFKKWKDNKTPFAFCDLGLMIRKSSLPYLGLFNPDYFRLDAEYTLRASALPKTRIAWYTGHCWVRMANEMSVSTRNPKNMIGEWEKLELIYLGKKPRGKTVYFAFKVMRKIMKVIRGLILFGKKEQKNMLNKYSWEEHCEKAALWLEKMNKNNGASFHT